MNEIELLEIVGDMMFLTEVGIWWEKGREKQIQSWIKFWEYLSWFF